MKTTFAAAVLFGLAAAGRGRTPNAGEKRFSTWAARYNADLSSTEKFEKAKGRFAQSAELVDRVNGKAQKQDDLRLELNQFAAMDEDEFLRNWTGLAPGLDAIASTFEEDSGAGRRMTHAAVQVDHHAAGNMQPVKNQGGCGSCWAFTCSTALEGTIKAKTGVNPGRFSEQQLVDCTLTRNQYNQSLFGKDYGCYGCQGAWMNYAWEFWKDWGIMLDADYPYTSGSTGRETQCAHDNSKTVGKVGAFPRIYGVDAMKAAVQVQPISVALDASGVFQLYKSGVIKSTDGCGSSLNHAVVVVGYTDGTPAPEPEPEPLPSECTVHKWWHECTTSNARRLATDSEGLTNYWKIQNSWGTGWGDGGFVRIEIAAGDGVCRINAVVEKVDMA